MTNFVRELQSAAMTNTTATAVECDEPVTFSQLWSATDSFAGGLQDSELTAGDRVTVHLSDPRSFLIAVYGTLRAGCVPVTIPEASENRDVKRVVAETEPKAHVADSGRIMALLNGSESLRLAVIVDDEVRLGVSLSTFLENDGMNGSNSRTGIDVVRRADDSPGLIASLERDAPDPLAVVYTHASLRAAANVGTTLGPTESDGELESHRSALSLSNPIELMYGANATLTDGGSYHPIPDPDPETIRSLLVTTDIERTFVTPQQYRALRASDPSVDEGELRVVTPLSTALDTEVRDGGDAVRLCVLPEIGVSHVRSPVDVEAGRLGRSLPGVRACVLEEGGSDELAVSGPALMDGYFDRPVLTDETVTTIDGDRWIETGLSVQSRDGTIDLGERAETGRTLPSDERP
ncbi:AMP-binding protein [Natrinema longum]|uniref:Acyl--CoA ligase n=2 Tax=Natrinema longum TaxID=370324 RepID=A0A8A2U9R2_9EURY|nr:AMP-binding protein [Natrinema longum]MBZ6496686.1 acyl--CoA ligase [Natrinema longum]QSW85420.1 acyl--CoA ligase [Natrinema longum]